MSESGNDNPRPETVEGGAPPEPPTVPPWQPPVHDAPPAPAAHRGRTRWVALAVGLGCLTPIILGLVFFAAAKLFWSHRAELHGGRHDRPVFSLRLGEPNQSPYAAHVKAWRHTARGAPADRDLRAFEKQLDGWAFEKNGERAQRDVGDVVSYAAETEFASDGTSGVSIVTLGGESGKKVRLYVSFDQEVNGAWEFKLDMYR
jgi:hypothetical protein